jgi:hypothetical protein
MREIPQMGVPGERHKNIREQQQTSGAKEDRRSDSSSCVGRYMAVVENGARNR